MSETPRVWAAEFADKTLKLRGLDLGGHKREVSAPGCQIPRGWRLMAALQHSGGWSLAIQATQPAAQYRLIHLDTAGEASATPTFTADDGLAWLNEVLSVVVPRGKRVPHFAEADFNARAAMFLAMQGDPAAVRLLAQHFVTIITDPQRKIPASFSPEAAADAAAAAPVLADAPAFDAAYVDALFEANPALNNSHWHVLSFVPGVCIARNVVGTKAALCIYGPPGMRMRAIYVPERRTLIGLAADRPRADVLADMVARQLLGLLCLSADVSRYMQTGIKQVGLQSSDRRDDLYLRGDLAALDQAVNADVGRIVKNIYVSWHQPEQFGPLEELIPKYAHPITRQAGPKDWLRSAFENQEAVFKLEARYIPYNLVARIVRAAQDASEAFADELDQATRAMERRFKQQPLRLIVSLKNDRGAWPQQAEAYAALARKLAEAGCPTVFVFDGLNAEPSDPPNFAASGIEALRRTIEAFRASTTDISDKIICFDTVGKPAAHSLAAGLWSHGFIAPWGPELAKHKWIINAPGLVLANPKDRENPDFEIYDLRSVRERVAPSDYPPFEEAVETIDAEVFADACFAWLLKRWPQRFPRRKSKSGFSLLGRR